MKLPLAGLVLSAFVLVPPAPRTDDSIVFAVAKESRLRKSFEHRMELQLEKARMTLAGQELPESKTQGFAIRDEKDAEYVVVDEYREVADGRPRELLRRFEKLDRHVVSHHARPEHDPEDRDESKESALVGHTLRFAWNDDSRSYDVTWVGEAGDGALLEKLDEDMDLRALLPERPVSVHDTWELSPKAALHVVRPGGRLGFADENDFDLDFADSFAGSARATYTGTREEDGARLAMIEIELEGKGEKPPVEKDGGTEKASLSLDLHFELLWNLSEERAQSLEITGPIQGLVSFTREVEVRGKKLPLDVELELGGEARMSGKFERD